MKKIAVTGRIATGKTSVLNQFKYFGCRVFNSDEMVKNIYKKDIDIISKIKCLTPSVIEKENINMKLLSDLAFKSNIVLFELEKIIHPKLKILRNRLTKKSFFCDIKTIVFEVPLLFEKKIEKEFDIIVSTTCNSSLQKRRYLWRKNSSTEKFININKKFLNDNERFKRSHFTINTGLGKTHSIKLVNKILKRT